MSRSWVSNYTKSASTASTIMSWKLGIESASITSGIVRWELGIEFAVLDKKFLDDLKDAADLLEMGGDRKIDQNEFAEKSRIASTLRVPAGADTPATIMLPPPAEDDVADGSPSGGQAKDGTPTRRRTKTTNVLMIETLAKDPDSAGLSIRQWESRIGRSISSIHGTPTWKMLKKNAEEKKAERALDRHRKRSHVNKRDA
jgi:hypothetical protein